MSGEPLSRDDVVRAAETIRGRVRRTPLLDGADVAPGPPPQGGAPPAHGLVQGARRHEPACGDERRGAQPRGRRGLGRQPCDRARVGRRPRRARMRRLLVARPEARSSSTAHARSGRGSTSRPPIRPMRSQRLEAHLAATGAALVHPFDDPLVMAGQGTVGLEILEDAPETTVVVVRGRRRRARGRDRHGGRAARRPRGRRRAGRLGCAPACARGGRARACHATARSRAASTPRTSAGTPSRRARPRAWRSSRCRTTRSPPRCAASTRMPSSRASPPARRASPPFSRGLVEGESVVAVVSGGNVGPDIASGILAGR